MISDIVVGVSTLSPRKMTEESSRLKIVHLRLEMLQNQKREPEARSALAVLRGDTYDPSEELAEMRRAAEQASSKKSGIFDLTRSPATRKAMLASFGAMFFQQMSGINAVIFYTTTIFEESGSSMPADVASIIIALVQVRR